jgi:Arc/MetJ-type ribon-helix-helix transcriptional regulator
MSASRTDAEAQGSGLQEILRLVHALDAHGPGEIAALLAEPDLEDEDRRALAAVARLWAVRSPAQAAALLPWLKASPDEVLATGPDIVIGRMVMEVRQAGAARKVSVSMPEELTAAVQRRVGRGRFSQYVTEAVARQFELDLLTELSELLSAEHGPVPEEHLAEARAAWPDSE